MRKVTEWLRRYLISIIVLAALGASLWTAVQVGDVKDAVVTYTRNVVTSEDGMQVLVDTWKWKNPATGGCVTKSVSTTKAAGQTIPEWVRLHNEAVEAAMAEFPPSPDCP